MGAGKGEDDNADWEFQIKDFGHGIAWGNLFSRQRETSRIV